MLLIAASILAARKLAQVDGGKRVPATVAAIAKRYARRKGSVEHELASYDAVRTGSKTEKRINQLEGIADVVIATDRCDSSDVLVRAASHVGLFGRQQDQLVDVVVGGQFGSEGKGHICSFLAPEYDVLVRVGGPNAGHKVFQDPEPYTHRQLPSGTLFSNAKLLIGPGAVIDVDTLMKETADCDVDASRLSIDPQAMVITKQDKKSEAKLVEAIGSTGQGVGAAAARRITDRVKAKHTLARDNARLAPFCRPIANELEEAFAKKRRVLVEGTQGSGLSIYHGIYPYVTSRDTTVAGCLAESGISPTRVRKVVMVCRSYVIRVKSPAESTSGPLKGELSWQDISERSGIPIRELQTVEMGSVSQKQRRVGEFDWVQLRRAALLNAPTDIAERLAQLRPLDTKAAEAATDARKRADDSQRVADESARALPPPVERSQRLKDLYRTAAKQLHPDLAQDERDRMIRERLMTEANLAYAEGDEAKLEAILEEYQSSPDTVVGSDVGAELIRIIRRISLAQANIRKVETEIGRLGTSEIHKLKTTIEEGRQGNRDVLGELVESLRHKIRARRQYLQSL